MGLFAFLNVVGSPVYVIVAAVLYVKSLANAIGNWAFD